MLNPDVKNGCIIYFGSKFWYKDGLYHREGGPSIEWIFGDKEWYINGKRHRLDGPAYESFNGSKAWYYEGERINVDSQEEFERVIKLNAFW